LSNVKSANASDLTEGTLDVALLPPDITVPGNVTANVFMGNTVMANLDAEYLGGNLEADCVISGTLDAECVIIGGNLSLGVPIQLPSGSNAEPSLSFTGALDTGVYLNAQNNMTFVSNNKDVFQITENHIVPASNDTYNLGTADHRFGELFLAGNTIYLGNVRLSATQNEFILPASSVSGHTLHGTGTISRSLLGPMYKTTFISSNNSVYQVSVSIDTTDEITEEQTHVYLNGLKMVYIDESTTDYMVSSNNNQVTVTLTSPMNYGDVLEVNFYPGLGVQTLTANV